MATDIDKFVMHQLKLLDMELEAEIAENRCLYEGTCVKELQKRGIFLKNLKITKTSTGESGRVVKVFEYAPDKHFPPHSIGIGDVLGVSNMTSENKPDIIAEGISLKIGESSITVDFGKNYNSPSMESDSRYFLIKIGNNVTYQRMKKAVERLRLARTGPVVNLISVLFGHSIPRSVNLSVYNNVTFVNESLNESQKEAITFALSQLEIAVIHGPPGTGKTTTVVEIILQAVSQGQKVLACAPSNVAVDNLVEKLAMYKAKMVRLGHPARFLPSIYEHSLESIMAKSDGGQVISDLHKEIDKVNGMINEIDHSRRRLSLQFKKRDMVADLKKREKTVMRQTLANCDIVLSTLVSAHETGPLKNLPEDHFHLVVIDECSQALEAASWIALNIVPKCILAGDHHQLPPTIQSEEAAKDGLKESLMQRIINMHGDLVVKMLHVQYRMHQDLMEWPSKQLYENKLKADSSVVNHLLKDLPEVVENENTSIPLLLIDTTGCHLDELVAKDDESKGNEGEADVVVAHVSALLSSGVNQSDVAVVTPYSRQVDIIKSKIQKDYPKVEVKSIDGFQGREKEAIVLSLVRSNCKGEVGFLCEDRRINVAITRARRHLAVICNTETVSHHSFLKSLVSFIQERGEVRTAAQYEKDIGLYPTLSTAVIPKTSVTKKKRQTGHKKLKTLEKVPTIDDEVKESRDSVHERFKDTIHLFMESSEYVYTFSPTLNAFERRIVHEVAEEFGLFHESRGEEANRYIEIKKIPCSEEIFREDAASNESQGEDDFNVSEIENVVSANEHVMKGATCGLNESHKDDGSHNPNYVSSGKVVEKVEQKCKHDSKVLSVNNTAVNTIQCKKAPSVKVQKSKPKIKASALDNPNLPDDDFDALLATVVKADKTCSYKDCKTCIAALSQKCTFCKYNFCFSHFIPEAHGCGPSAKAHARSQIRKDGKIYPGSGRPEKKQDPARKAQLQRKFDKKMGELSKQRKSKVN